MSWLNSIFLSPGRIDIKLDGPIPSRLKAKLIVHTNDLPSYRFVDLLNTVNAVVGPRDNLIKLETQQNETLNQIINDPTTHFDRTKRLSQKVSWQAAARRYDRTQP
jgi:hypothetical protein